MFLLGVRDIEFIFPSYLTQAPESPVLYDGDVVLVEINMVQFPENKLSSSRTIFWSKL